MSSNYLDRKLAIFQNELSMSPKPFCWALYQGYLPPHELCFWTGFEAQLRGVSLYIKVAYEGLFWKLYWRHM